MCNWLVCLAVWMSYKKDMTGNICYIFPGFHHFKFEHSIANMYYIPAGIMAKGNKALVDAAACWGNREKLSL